MIQEEKQLVFIDLCARLPYGVVAERTYVPENSGYTSEITAYALDLVFDDNWSVKPYLRPMSSMTEEEEKELSYIAGLHRSKYGFVNHIDGYPGNSIFTEVVVARAVDFFNAHHFDYRGLIEKGLALEAPEGIYKNE